MASTKLSDVIVPEVYSPYALGKTVELNKFIASGIASKDPDLRFPDMTRQVKGGKTIHIPFWKNLVDADNAEDEIYTDTDDFEINNIEAGESIAAVLTRTKIWGSHDLARYFSGSDPMMAIADMDGAYWANREQHVLLSVLAGITDKTAGAIKDHVLDISGGTGDAAVLSNGAMIDAMYLMGDHVSQLGGIACNSAVMSKLTKLNLIDTVRAADSPIEYKYFMGKPVIVDDAIQATAGAHPIYFFGQGAIAYNEDTEGIENTELDRDKIHGTDILITRRVFTMHPRGLKWVGTPVKTTASNSELATAANWELADNIKNIPITKLIAKV
jgi:hypothetical protein